jgi:hypothetical protein
MKALLCVATTMTFLVAGQLSPAMADGPRASNGHTPAKWSLASDTPVRTVTASSRVTHQTRSAALYELDPEVQRLYDDIMRRAGVPLSELR